MSEPSCTNIQFDIDDFNMDDLEYDVDYVFRMREAVDWGDVENKPSTFPPSGHNHDNLYYTKPEVNEFVKSGTWTPTVNGVDVITSKGWYIKIGKTVVIGWTISGTSAAGGTSASLYIEGTSLPFAPSQEVANYAGGGSLAGAYFPARAIFAGYRMATVNGNIIPLSMVADETAGTRTVSNAFQGNSQSSMALNGTLMYATEE